MKLTETGRGPGFVTLHDDATGLVIEVDASPDGVVVPFVTIEVYPYGKPRIKPLVELHQNAPDSSHQGLTIYGAIR